MRFAARRTAPLRIPPASKPTGPVLAWLTNCGRPFNEAGWKLSGVPSTPGPSTGPPSPSRRGHGVFPPECAFIQMLRFGSFRAWGFPAGVCVCPSAQVRKFPGMGFPRRSARLSEHSGRMVNRPFTKCLRMRSSCFRQENGCKSAQNVVWLRIYPKHFHPVLPERKYNERTRIRRNVPGGHPGAEP